MSYASEVLADSPLVYLKLDEIGGTSAADSSGNGRNGSYQGSDNALGYQTLLPGDPGGRSVGFGTGSTDAVVIPHDTVFDPTHPFTAHFWVRTPTVLSAVNDKIAGNSLNSTGAGWMLYKNHANSDDLEFVLGPGSNATWTTQTSFSFAAATVYHIALTWSANIAIPPGFFLNGVQKATTVGATSAAITTTTADLWFGNSANFTPPASSWVFDELVVVPSVLSPQRIAAIYATGIAASQVDSLLPMLHLGMGH